MLPPKLPASHPTHFSPPQQCPGDVAKALGAGADFVMCGGIFAGHDESGGALIERNGAKYKAFYGMSSSVAMRKHAG